MSEDILLRILRTLEDYHAVNSVAGSFFCGWLRECGDALSSSNQRIDELTAQLANTEQQSSAGWAQETQQRNLVEYWKAYAEETANLLRIAHDEHNKQMEVLKVREEALLALETEAKKVIVSEGQVIHCPVSPRCFGAHEPDCWIGIVSKALVDVAKNRS